MYKWWYLVVAFRVLMVLAPQTGYIHPDEFFQTTEVVAGDLFNIEVYRPWEFNSSQPIRSIVLPFTVLGLPLKVVQLISSYTSCIHMAYLALILPRMAVTILSLVVDLSVYKLSRSFNVDTSKALLLLSSSYVTSTFLTRTFTNSLETYLYSLLLIFVYSGIEDFKLANAKNLTKLPKSENFDDAGTKKTKFRYNRKRHKVKGKDFIQEMNNPEPQTYKYTAFCIGIGVVLVMGVFNRPTFTAFAIVPILFWLYVCFEYSRLIRSFIITGFSVVITFSVVVLLDSLYFHPDIANIFQNIKDCITENFQNRLSCLSGVFQEFVMVTPWNFIRYNTQKENLAKHGIHPHYLHFIVNLPLLYGPLFVCVILQLINILYNCVQNKANLIKTIIPINIFIPVLFLSAFPHQEPRFLVPLLPIIIISAIHFFEKSKFWTFLIIVNFMFNIPLLILFGFLHQGGVLQSLIHVQAGMVKGDYSEQDRFIFYHTYMPPRYLLHSKTATSQVIDLQGKNIDELYHNFNVTLISQQEKSLENPGKMYLILPGTTVDEVIYHKPESILTSIHQRFCCHLSMEDPPDIKDLLSELYTIPGLKSLMNIYDNFVYQTSLHMISIKV